MTNIFNYLLIFNVFAGGFVLLAPLPFEFYLGYIFIISFLIMYIFKYRKFDINFTFLIILIWLTNFSLVNVYFGNNTLPLMIKQVVGILIMGSAYYLLIRVNDYEIDKLFKIYLRIALIVAVIGIIQECCFLAGFKYGYDYSWLIKKWGICPVARGGMLRVNSIFYEPSHFAITMAPAFFVSLISIFRNNSFYLSRKASITIIICYILTFSAVGYFGIVLSLLLILFNVKKPKHLLITLLIIVIFIFISYCYIPDMSMRVNDIIKVAIGSLSLTESHLSLYAIVSNSYVAFKSSLNSPIWGYGLGSHPISYDKFIPSNVSGMFWHELYTGVNKKDAGSLFLRLVSETGLFGITVVFYFIFKFFVKTNVNKNLQIINNSIFILFILQLLRQGHYFYNGLFFFVWVYYFAYKINKKHNLVISES